MIDEPNVPADLGEEPRVQEVQNGVLDATAVEVDGTPGFGLGGVEG